jgi:hypothetical protein
MQLTHLSSYHVHVCPYSFSSLTPFHFIRPSTETEIGPRCCRPPAEYPETSSCILLPPNPQTVSRVGLHVSSVKKRQFCYAPESHAYLSEVGKTLSGLSNHNSPPTGLHNASHNTQTNNIERASKLDTASHALDLFIVCYCSLQLTTSQSASCDAALLQERRAAGE